MRTHALSVFLAVLLAGCAADGPPDPQAALDELVAAERAFAQASVEQGIRSAFLAYLADEAIIFRPTPTNGPAWYRERPAVPGTLAWQPVLADVAGAGELGYTSGPWTYTAPDTTAAVAHGHYVSVWRKQPDGAWRVEIDAGVSHPRSEASPPEQVAVPPGGLAPAEALRSLYVEAARVSLLKADRDLAEASASHGSVAAFAAASDDAVRVYRDGVFPAVGKAALAEALRREEGVLAWVPLAAHVAASGDLGYTYGLATAHAAADSTAATSTYLRLWRRPPEGPWRVVLDLASPIPPEE